MIAQGSGPRISLIAAMAENRVIGRNNRLPWHLPVDLARFKRITMGKSMLMGRKTWESLPGLLPGRRHIVLSRDSNYRAEGAELVHTLQAALQQVPAGAELLVIGGADLYAQCLPLAQRMYLTLVQTRPDGDAWFPEYDAARWREIASESHPADSRNPHACRFLTLQRIGVDLDQGEPD